MEENSSSHKIQFLKSLVWLDFLHLKKWILMIFSSLDFVISIILFYHFFFTSVVPVFNFLSKSALSCCQRYLYLILGVKLCKHGLLPSKNIWYHRQSSKWCWALTHCGSLVIEHLDGEVCSLAMILKKLLSSVAFHYD